MVHAFRVAARVEPDRKGVAVGVGLVLAAIVLLSMVSYLWEDWRTRSLSLAFLGLAWSPAVAGLEKAAKSMREVAGG